MGMQTAAALESAGLLRSAHVDVCLRPGTAARALERVAGGRVANRVVHGVPAARLHPHPQLAAAARLKLRLRLRGRDTTAVDRVLAHMFASVARRCASDAVVGTQSSSLELFEGRARKILEQVSPPLRYERALAKTELARFPGWAPEGVTRASGWDRRMEAEWEVADLIWAPSRHVVEACARLGADPRRFRVIPYPTTVPVCGGAASSGGRDGKLRVIFAGTLMLEKGVQYIYRALRQRPGLPVRMEFFGGISLTPEGVARLAEVGTVHGPVHRSQLLAQFRRADVLLLPSLSEGSALVTLEAAALGLPVVATGEAGAPASAMLIPARDPDAIAAALEELADDPARLGKLSEAGLAEAARRNIPAYEAAVTESARTLLA
jgi:glycosyltransferase involved in cell wall biosynthesis